MLDSVIGTMVTGVPHVDHNQDLMPLTISMGLTAILAMSMWPAPRADFPVQAHCRVAEP